MRYEWDEAKRQKTLKERSLDFADAHLVFHGPTIEFEDTRAVYHEQRMVCIGFLPPDKAVVVVYAEVVNGEVTRIISMRKAERIEQDRLYSHAGY